MSLNILSKKLNYIIIDEIWPADLCKLPQIDEASSGVQVEANSAGQNYYESSNGNFDTIGTDSETNNVKMHMVLRKRWLNEDNCVDKLLNALVGYYHSILFPLTRPITLCVCMLFIET